MSTIANMETQYSSYELDSQNPERGVPMDTNINKVIAFRDKREKEGLKEEELRKFDALFHSYKRNLTDGQDFSDAQVDEFIRFFAAKPLNE